ncbi:MAG: hypothetical protein PHN18_10350 [Sulfurospirillaceae bacterium]|nr:hypothetical protein [Sulfurospirillaceae bacterium]MDD2827460.1 hypothetical protein [Sulfurospirillaceae bacterium]
MEFAKKTNGAVFFVDILGFGALIQNKIKLKKIDFKPWLESYKLNDSSIRYTNQFLAASLLSTFRSILFEMQNQFVNVQIAQLSDCAFIWSEKILDIVVFANNFMTRAIKSGLLCRGGLAYGEIIETDNNDNHRLGKFIVGDAVTNAVKLEGLAKGCRILINQELPAELSNQCANSHYMTQMFQPFTNPLDYSVYDEFKWYLLPNMEISKEIRSFSTLQKVHFTKERLKLVAELRFGEKFLWNVSSKEGFVQIRASIDFLSDYDANFLEIWHDFNWSSSFIESKNNRTLQMCNRVKKEIEISKNYQEVIKTKKGNKLITEFIDIKKTKK